MKQIKLDGKMVDLDTLIRGRVKIRGIGWMSELTWVIPVWETELNDDPDKLQDCFQTVDQEECLSSAGHSVEYETYKPHIKDKKPSDRILELYQDQSNKMQPTEKLDLVYAEIISIIQYLDEQHELPEGK